MPFSQPQAEDVLKRKKKKPQYDPVYTWHLRIWHMSEWHPGRIYLFTEFWNRQEQQVRHAETLCRHFPSQYANHFSRAVITSHCSRGSHLYSNWGWCFHLLHFTGWEWWRYNSKCFLSKIFWPRQPPFVWVSRFWRFNSASISYSLTQSVKIVSAYSENTQMTFINSNEYL